MPPRPPFYILPDRKEHPFRNMEEDLLLLYQNPAPGALLFRNYEWEFPCWTCGYSQKFNYVQERTGGTKETIFRRATGGGIVPHFHDWTFTLVIGKDHPAYCLPPRSFYDLLHQDIASILANEFQTPATLHNCKEDLCNGAPPTECFQSPVLSDVLHAEHGEKIAGAAIKKTREGILLQGSIQKDHLPEIDWESFKEALARDLAQSFETTPSSLPWPFTPEDGWPPYSERIHCPLWREN